MKWGAMSNFYYHPRGSDLIFAAQWIDTETGLPIPLTGVTLTPFEVTPPGLAASILMTVTDPANGGFVVSCPWSSAWPDGIGHLVNMRAKASTGDLLSINIPVVLI